MVILCLDYGERYVGVAITDPEGKMPLRHSVIDQKENDVLDVIGSLIEKEEVGLVLVGVPVSLSGRQSSQTQVSLLFMEKLRDMLQDEVPVEGVDETLTSVEAARNIKAEGGKIEDEHAEAARIMLDSYLSQAK